MVHPIDTGNALIAPCGMNCSICMAYLREHHFCSGCRSHEGYQANHCSRCVIRNCSFLKETTSRFCYECTQFPCKRLIQLDNRYKFKYHMSMIQNLLMIKDHGLETFVQQERVRWKCPDCGGKRCVHRGYCLRCKSTPIS